ncbi:MAG: AAA family ATPase [Gracilibacteraceae bacterium]|jgi:chromosome partitioning protein|nr:AAA family ATPase [Gracilibacteraceae bacterium]
MGVVVAVANQKGGVGKTSTANALALGFQRGRKKVLAIDLDPQGNLSFSLGAETDNMPTAFHVLAQECAIGAAIQKTPLADVVAGDITLSSVNIDSAQEGWEFILRDALGNVRAAYDYIIIDTPPALSVLTVNAFTAADGLLVPILADIFSLQGLTRLNDTVARVREYSNPDLQLLGIVLTRFNPRTVLSREIRVTASMIADELGLPLLKTTIRASVAIAEAQSMQVDMFKYMPRNNAVQDYKHLVRELKERGL